MEREVIQEALRAERLKTALSEHNRECLGGVSDMIDERVDAFARTDFKELRKDFDIFTTIVNKAIDEVRSKLGVTMTQENGNKTVGRIDNVIDKINTLASRMNTFEDETNKRIDGYSYKGKLVPGIMGQIASLTSKTAAIERAAEVRGETWRYALDIFFKILPIVVSASALAFAIYSKR